MRVVKALVVFMGILIVIGIGLVVYGLSLEKNTTETDSQAASSNAPSAPLAGSSSKPTAPTAPMSSFGDINVGISSDERLISYEIDGGQATLHIEGPDGANARLVIVSLTSQKVLGQVLLQPTAN